MGGDRIGARGSGGAAGPGPIAPAGLAVLLPDARAPRQAIVGEVLRELGVALDGLPAGLESGPSWRTPVLRLAAVDQGAEAWGQYLDLVRSARERDRPVIAYADGADHWSLRSRSEILLSGACRLLDSARADFPRRLRTELTALLERDRCRLRDEHELAQTMRDCGIVGHGPAMQRLFRWAARTSLFTDFPVLLTGETGTGKELFARAIHRLDPKRRTGPMVTLNCAAVPTPLADAMLFGHQRGAFTGADRERQGLCRAADGGVLFLDEIGELDPEAQGKLLRVLQERRVLAVGSDSELPVDIRVVTATHRDLRAMASQGRFRSDLLHRLDVLSVEIPPLRERREDIGPLVRHLLQRARPPGSAATNEVDDDFVKVLSEIDLPGNVRELDNIVQRALATKEDDGPLCMHDLPPEIWRRLLAASQTAPAPQAEVPPPRPAPTGTDERPADGDCNLALSLAQCERLALEAAIRRAGGNQSEAARLLGITPRSVYNKLRKHGLDAAPRRAPFSRALPDRNGASGSSLSRGER